MWYEMFNVTFFDSVIAVGGILKALRRIKDSFAYADAS
jgi:hypothetical protein